MTVHLTFHGTCFSTADNQPVSLDLYLNGNNIATATGYSNDSQQHRLLCPVVVPVDLSQDFNKELKIEIKAGPNTTIDQNDRFTVYIDY